MIEAGRAGSGGPGHVGDGGRVVQIAPRGRVGQQEMVAHQFDQGLHVGGDEPHTGGHPTDDVHAHLGVVAREPLADVMEQGPDEQQVRPLHPVGELGGQRGGLEQMPIDRKGVVGVALRLVAHRGPFGDEADQEPVLVE